MRRRFPKLRTASDDICYATQNPGRSRSRRWHECELVIVVGSRNSSFGSAGRGGAGCRGAGRPPGGLGRDIDSAWLDSVTTVGVTSGISPQVLVRGVLERLAECGPMQPVTAAETLARAAPR